MPEASIELAVSPELVAFLVMRLREFDAKEEAVELDPASNSIDDEMLSVLEDMPEDAVEEELREAIDDLTIDEQLDLVALAWLGRGDGDKDDWDALRRQAAEARTGPTSRYLMGIPLVADYLEDGLAALGISLVEYEQSHLSPS
jgi:hypothetical protein